MDKDKYWTDKVLTIEGSESMHTAAKLMLDKKVSSLLVVKDEKPIGIVTEKDIVEVMGRGLDPDESSVSDFMTQDPVTVDISQEPEAARKLMVEHDFRHMPVVDLEGDLVGIVSLRDLVKVQEEKPGIRTIKFVTQTYEK